MSGTGEDQPGSHRCLLMKSSFFGAARLSTAPEINKTGWQPCRTCAYYPRPARELIREVNSLAPCGLWPITAMVHVWCRRLDFKKSGKSEILLGEQRLLFSIKLMLTALSIGLRVVCNEWTLHSVPSRAGNMALPPKLPRASMLRPLPFLYKKRGARVRLVGVDLSSHPGHGVYPA